MLVYAFTVHNNDATEIEKLGGMTLTNDGEALAFGVHVIRDLMREGAGRYAGWTMEVAEDARAVGSIPFNQKEQGSAASVRGPSPPRRPPCPRSSMVSPRRPR